MSLPREGSRDTGQGIIVSLSPDVCKTPVGSAMVPIPYAITAIQGDDANTVATVRMTGLRAHNMASLVTKCTGDAPGTGMGVVSGTVGSVCHPKSHSDNVRISGEWAIRHQDEWWMNNRNTVGKLTYIRTQQTFAQTPAVTLAQNPALEAPEPILLADASPNWAQYLQPAEPQTRPAPRPAPPPIARRPPPNRLARPPARQFRFQPKPPPGYRFSPTGALLRLRRLTPLGIAAAVFFHQNIGFTNGEIYVGNVDITNLDPVERGLFDTATQAFKDGGDHTETREWFASEVNRYRREKAEAETVAPPQVGVTPGNTRVEGQRRRRRPCNVRRYGSLTCPVGEQAHHIVPDSTLRYGNRADGEAGRNRIPGMPSFRDGMAICLAGNAADRTGGHGIAHGVTDPLMAAAGQSAAIPGTATVAQAKAAGIAGATAARPDCAREITAAVTTQFAPINSGRLVNAANRPARGAALDALSKGQ